MLLRIATVLAILAFLAILAPHASAAPLDQRGNGVHVGVGGHHGGNVVVVNRGFRHPWGVGFRGFGPGFGFAPFVPVAAFPPPVVPVAVPVPVSVPVAVPQVNYAPALAAPNCGCPQ